jgi:AcrR family transcriptional regulator
MRSNNKRNDILEAALKVVEESGANHLTIDAVAQCSGFSKGGILYHFGSKKGLLCGMRDYLIEANRRRTEALTSNDNPLAALLHVENRMSAAERRASLAVVAAAAEDPELLVPAREYMKEVIEEIVSSSKDPANAMILFLANEGLRYLDIFELNPMTVKESKKLINELSRRAGNS